MGPLKTHYNFRFVPALQPIHLRDNHKLRGIHNAKGARTNNNIYVEQRGIHTLTRTMNYAHQKQSKKTKRKEQ